MLKQFLLAFALAAGIIAESHAAEAGFAPQTSNERGVKVTVTPQNLSTDAQTWDFEMTLEAHTQNLNDDLTKTSLLIVDGKQFAPLGWDGAPPGSHHRKGKLSFKVISPRPEAVELQVRLAGDPAPRSFKWLLK